MFLLYTNWYNFQEGTTFCKNCKKKKIKNEIRMIFSCDKYDKIRRKTLNGINKVHKINLQTRKKEQN